MVQGTMSGAGKSLLCGALCRIFRQDGYRAVPFKSQNMALNSYITSEGLEMGRAQVMQAEAAGVEPDVRMNPVLLKPSSDTGSQVIVNGKVLGDMSARDYFRFKDRLVPDIMEAYRFLAEENDIVVIEGAGSPAEINLKQNDIVNMGLAEMVDAPVLLAGDIDRGGVFAQLYGTAALLEESERRRIRGMLINKFRGDKEILMPGVRMIEERTGIPVLGIIPYMNVDIDEEDSLAPRLSGRKNADLKALLDIAVIRFPRISNFTDFAPLEADPLLSVRYVDRLSAFGHPDLVILPGTKSTLDDLAWLRESGLEAMILKFAATGGAVLGICGGFQMLGEELLNPEHSEGIREGMRGLSLLPVRTVFTAQKTRTRVHGITEADPIRGAVTEAYEIHMGRTERFGGEPFCLLEEDTPGGGKKEDGCRSGNVLGTYLHGLFDSGEVAEKIAAWLCGRKGIAYNGEKRLSRKEYENREYDRLAAGVREALDMDAVYEMIFR